MFEVSICWCVPARFRDNHSLAHAGVCEPVWPSGKVLGW